MKLKKYTNQPRKPMMYGGKATKGRAKMSQGGTVTDDARRAEISQQYDRDPDSVRAMANGRGRDALIARSVLREKGGADGVANTPTGDKEPTN